jgi:hypothetical protein
VSEDHASRWRLLGEELTRRRVGLGHTNLPKFQRDTPGAPAYSVLTAVEAGRKPSYTRTIKAQIELMYQLQFGAIDHFMAGETDELEVLEDDERGRLRVELERRGVSPHDLRRTIRTLSALADLVNGGEPGLGEDRRAVGLAG